MDNALLSPQNFSSVFEIFAGYYLLLGTNRKFHDYFNIAGVFKNWIGNYDEISKLSSNINELEASWLQEIRAEQPLTETVDAHANWINQQRKEIKRIKKRKNEVKKLGQLSQELKFEVETHFGSDPEADEETEFYRFVKPFYIFFGCLSMAVLALCGFFSEWQKLTTLNILNWIGIVILFLMFFEIFRNHYQRTSYIEVNPVATFVFSIVFLTIIVLIPSTFFGSIKLLDYIIPESRLSYHDSQVILIVGLIFMPIIIHILTLSLIVKKHARVERLRQRLASYLSPINAPQIQDDIPTLN